MNFDNVKSKSKNDKFLNTMRTNLPKTLDQLILVSFTKYLVNVTKLAKY